MSGALARLAPAGARVVLALAVGVLVLTPEVGAQQQGGARTNGTRRPAPTTRAESLYVSADPADHSTRDWAEDITTR